MNNFQVAIRSITRDHLSNNCHTAYVGLGDAGEPVIVCQVDKKHTPDVLTARNIKPIPKEIEVRNQKIKIKVDQSPQPSDRRLYHNDRENHIQRGGNHDCFDCPVPGGAQIAPAGANWVGTLSAGLQFDVFEGGGLDNIFGAFTNYHVAVKENARQGDPICQPTSGDDYIATLERWAPMDFSPSGANRLDVALLDCRRSGGKWGENTDTVSSEMLDLGPYNPLPLEDPAIGQEVIKVGRTTGITRGVLVGIEATTRVNYGPGKTARFVGQYIFKGKNGDFSAAGDSGSLIMTNENLRPVSLLFAGGGGTTIGNRISDVLEWSGGHFYTKPKGHELWE